MSKHQRTENKLIQKDLMLVALKESFVKLNPMVMVKNPVMFTVEVGTVIMIVLTIMLVVNPDPVQGSVLYNFLITLILLLTLLFANFAEAIAEAISEKEENKKKFKIVSDEGIQPLYSIAKDPTTGEVYTIDNQEPDLNARVKKIQIQSIEEAEQDLKRENLEIL